MAARKQKKQRRMSAQVVEDEDYQLRYEVVAGIDVAKESAVVCVQAVPATVPAITELAAELTAAGVQMVSMEATGPTGASGSRCWRRPGWRCSW